MDSLPTPRHSPTSGPICGILKLQPERLRPDLLETRLAGSTPIDRNFCTSSDLQDYLLQEAFAGAQVVVPHQRLAQQVWHRQRLAARASGAAAWEPLGLTTLQGWNVQLFESLWPQEILASPWQRLALWRQALKAAAPLSGVTSELEWAQSLDEAYGLLCRHLLPLAGTPGDDTALISWRSRVSAVYRALLREGGWLTSAELPAFLLAALRRGALTLPERVMVVGLETPAPAEAALLAELARQTRVIRLRVSGPPAAVRQAVVLPDPGQEMAWVAARLVELARSGLPLHRLAVTSPEMAKYAPDFERVLAAVLGPAAGADGGFAYNFSQGPALGDSYLFQAALLPLKFLTGGESREDLVSLLRSPFYGALQKRRERLALWDRVFRELRLQSGWEGFRQAVLRRLGPQEQDTANLLHRVWAGLRVAGPVSCREWIGRLRAAWSILGFPQIRHEGEAGQWLQFSNLLTELEAALGTETLKMGEFLDWLALGGCRLLVSGPGVQEAGIQVLGLLEMRGLDFSQVFCLGMNSGSFPQPPRHLPLLTAAERRVVLGGTFQSQHHFAGELYENFLGVAPRITLARPRLWDQEERVGTPLYLGKWEEETCAPLSTPDPAWLRAAAVRAALHSPRPSFSGYEDAPFPLPVPASLSLSKVGAGLACPCRFLLEVLLEIQELPEIEAGLDPRERGDKLHRVLATFTASFKEILQQSRTWDADLALQLLRQAAAATLASPDLDLHWQAEQERWLGDDGLLRAWLAAEQERFAQGWRWQGMEVAFRHLQRDGWLFDLHGRIDRLDCQGAAEVMVWDYKTGEIPGAKKIFDHLEEYQLPCYLLAVRSGLVDLDRQPAAVGAGYIGLKSSKAKHLKHEDFSGHAGKWEAVLAEFEERLVVLGRRLAAGDFLPNPHPAPAGSRQGACQYCGYGLICGYVPASAEGGEEGE
jgi:RecB family exonuclease